MVQQESRPGELEALRSLKREIKQTSWDNMLRNIIKKYAVAAALEEERRRRAKIVIEEYCEKMIREKR